MTTGADKEVVAQTDKRTAPDQGDFLVATKAIILRADGHMLTMRRSITAPTNPLGWDLPGGILELDEEADQGIIRETKEETNLEIEPPQAFHAIARPNNIGEHWVNIYYVANATSEEVTLSFEHDEFQWVMPETFGELRGSMRNKEAVAHFVALRAAGKI
jgi:ADP-ribose pyrophosphatase YjhB (NUDIX family)